MNCIDTKEDSIRIQEIIESTKMFSLLHSNIEKAAAELQEESTETTSN